MSDGSPPSCASWWTQNVSAVSPTSTRRFSSGIGTTPAAAAAAAPEGGRPPGACHGDEGGPNQGLSLRDTRTTADGRARASTRSRMYLTFGGDGGMGDYGEDEAGGLVWR